MPFCSELILKSIFPVALLKFLFILCVMTLAYLFLAWLIEYCIRHWPHQHYHNNNNCKQNFCCCTRCCNYYCVSPKKESENFCYLPWNSPTQQKQNKREFNNKTYLPAFLISSIPNFNREINLTTTKDTPKTSKK